MTTELCLFGGDKPWCPHDWTASDDRVRGGKSQSYLDCSPSSPPACFHGHLDIKALSGAGFASQRTTGQERNWDLSRYKGIVLDIEKSDGKRYTLTIKDELLPKSPDGREQSTISWEFEFQGPLEGKLFVPWDDFKATYRGRDKPDASPLDLRNVKRISLMMRSFFGTQEGDFSLSIVSISATTNACSKALVTPYRDDPHSDNSPAMDQEKAIRQPNNTSTWLNWLRGLCIPI